MPLSEGPPAARSDESRPAWRMRVEAATRGDAVRIAEERFRAETGREPLYVGPVREVADSR